jgi:hypothetical protein
MMHWKSTNGVAYNIKVNRTEQPINLITYNMKICKHRVGRDVKQVCVAKYRLISCSWETFCDVYGPQFNNAKLDDMSTFEDVSRGNGYFKYFFLITVSKINLKDLPNFPKCIQSLSTQITSSKICIFQTRTLTDESLSFVFQTIHMPQGSQIWHQNICPAPAMFGFFSFTLDKAQN